jgi:hypothetical protein
MKKLFGLLFMVGLTMGSFTLLTRGTEKISPVPPGWDASYYLIFDWLMDANGDSLRDKFYQVVIVNGEVDSPGPGGQLQDDHWIRDFPSNQPKIQQRYKKVPGMVDMMITVHYDPLDSTDDMIQVGEKILLRVYDADSMQYATHYCELGPWTAKFELVEWVEEKRFGEWKLLPKKSEEN